MNDVLEFRNRMAEIGYEHTPNQAAEILEIMQYLRMKVSENSRERYEKISKMTLEEKSVVCKNHGCSIKELDDAVKIILMIYKER